MMFNVAQIKKSKNISEREFKLIEHQVKVDYPHDHMLFELHLVRALKDFKKTRLGKLSNKRVSLKKALR